MLNIFCSYIPMKYLTFNDKGIPPCLNDHIKHLIKKEKNIQEKP